MQDPEVAQQSNWRPNTLTPHRLHDGYPKSGQEHAQHPLGSYMDQQDPEDKVEVVETMADILEQSQVISQRQLQQEIPMAQDDQINS